MGITETLTVIFIVLKILNIISWSWFYVLLPEIIGIAIYVIAIIIYIAFSFNNKEYIKIKKFEMRRKK